MTLDQILNLVRTAQATMSSALDIAAVGGKLLSPGDQASLQAELARVREENDTGHARLQAKLGALT